MKGEWKYELEAAARGTAGTVEAQRGFTRQIGRSRRNLWIDWCQNWRKRLWFEKFPVDTEGTRGRRADCDCRSWITSESFSHTNSITFSVFIGAFSSEAFKSWVEIQEIWNMWGKNRRIVFILGWDATVCAPIVDTKWRETDWNTLSDPVKTVCMSCCVDFFGITRNHNVREASNTRNLKNQKTSDLWRLRALFMNPSRFDLLSPDGRPAGETEPPAAYFNVQESKSHYFPFPIVVPYRRCVGVRFKDFTRPRLDKL